MAEQNPKETRSGNAGAKQGASLVIVICIAALLMSFALSMLYTASLLLSRANRRLEQESSYMLAQSFAQVIDQELTGKDYKNPNDPEVPPVSFYKYACEFLNGRYGEYDPDHPDETICHYTGASAGAADQYGSVKVRIFKEANQEQDDEMSGTQILSESYNQDILNILSNKIHRFDFTVEVIAEKNGVSYSYDTEYRQMVTYDVAFSNAEGAPIVCERETGNLYYNSIGGTPVDADTEIHYQYLPENIFECKFEKAY